MKRFNRNKKLVYGVLIILILIIIISVLLKSAKEYDNYSLPYQESSYNSYVNLSSGDIIIFQKMGNDNQEYKVYANSIFSELLMDINGYNKEFEYKNYQIKVKGINTNNHLLDVEVWNKNKLSWIDRLNFIKEFT